MILRSNGNFLEINILRRLYPESTDFWDANWLESEIKIEVPGFKGFYGVNLRADEFDRFENDLNKIKTGLSNYVEFKAMEEGLFLEGVVSMTGIITWNGVAKPTYGESSLMFKIDSDFNSINELLNQLCQLLAEFPVIGK